MDENNSTVVADTKKKRKLKPWQIVVISISSVLVALLIFVAVYVVYVINSYYRIGDQELTINKNATKTQLNVGDTYSAATYNIGFGAYSQDYTFFLDTGYDDEGNETCGHYSTAKSKEEVEFNTNGAITTLSLANPDFIMYQEVDTDSTRSYHINQNEKITSAFSSYDNTHAVNFHTAFLPYPLYDMHGTVNAGLTTLSRYQMQKAERKQYTVSDSLSKLFDLDRCFSYSTVNVSNGKTLYIVNSHMSAYDEGGVIRETQMKELNAFLKACHDEGNYCIVGGDFNHDLITYNPAFNYNESDHSAFNMTKKTPDWVSFFFKEDGTSPLTEGYSVVASDNVPTCRNNDIEWEKGKTFTCVVDGFIVSKNINVSRHMNIETNKGNKGTDWFAYSDHQPSYIEFELL